MTAHALPLVLEIIVFDLLLKLTPVVNSRVYNVVIDNRVGDIVLAFIDVVIRELKKGLKLNVNSRRIQFGQ